MINALTIILVAIGSAFLFLSFFPARVVWKKAPESMRTRWLAIVCLLGFFLVCYLFFDLILVSGLSFPTALVTGVVFMCGAVFAFIIMKLARTTIGRMSEAEQDVTSLNESLERRVADRARELQRSHDFVKTVLDSMRDAISIVDAEDFKIVGANTVFLREFRLSEDEVVGRKCYEVTHHRSEPCGPPNDTCPLAETASTGSHATAEHVHVDGGGGLVYEEVLTSPIRDDAGKIVQVVHVSRDITERKQSEEQIRLLAYYDPLTHLPNRTFFKELLARALLSAKRNGTQLSVLFIDIDFFKLINDTLGHSAGDRLLQTVAQRLVSCIRRTDAVARLGEDSSDVVSRLGGDEFIVLLSETSDANGAALVARRILESLSARFVLSGQEVSVSASIGISLYPHDGEDADTLLKNADMAMYHAKEQGRNTYQYFSASMNASARERLTLESDLRKALEREEFVVYYQSKIDIPSGRIIGAEALLRWRHAERGLVSPVHFIPLAEETGLIVPVGEWALRAAVGQNRAWQRAGLSPFPVSVNLSSRQFGQEDLLRTVIGILEDAGLEPRHLELEITESSIMQHPDKAIAVLRELKGMGIGVSIDDFGTGYSSLNYLRRLPLDSLKIDRSFITNITESSDDAAITAAVVAMAHNLKLTVLAEGVEREDQLALLRRLGCDQAQGYLFSRPVPADEFVALLRKRDV